MRKPAARYFCMRVVNISLIDGNDVSKPEASRPYQTSFKPPWGKAQRSVFAADPTPLPPQILTTHDEIFIFMKALQHRCTPHKPIQDASVLSPDYFSGGVNACHLLLRVSCAISMLNIKSTEHSKKYAHE